MLLLLFLNYLYYIIAEIVYYYNHYYLLLLFIITNYYYYILSEKHKMNKRTDSFKRKLQFFHGQGHKSFRTNSYFSDSIHHHSLSVNLQKRVKYTLLDMTTAS